MPSKISSTMRRILRRLSCLTTAGHGDALKVFVFHTTYGVYDAGHTATPLKLFPSTARRL